MDEYLSKSDIFALLVGSLCHDVDHRGFNTSFEVITRSELALRYNDSSPLENHHCALTFELAFSNGDANIFKDMGKDFYEPMRKFMVAAIIGTDMKFHGDHVKKAQRFDPEANAQADSGDRALFLTELMMHTSDIANPCMPPDISQRWCDVLCEEFAS